MKNIEVKVLNPSAIQDSEKLMVAMARMTQRGHAIHNMDDFMELLDSSYKMNTVKTMAGLPHPTIQKFGVINVVIVGASRRFLAQITRHQNEVKFMSGSLQYSDYTDNASFVVPYELTKMDADHVGNAQFEEGYFTRNYIKSCQQALREYEAAIDAGVPHDAAGYMMPQGMRNVLLISATPYQWKHMISQRVCRRNTLETQYVMLKCWEELNKYGVIFDNCGPFCEQPGGCQEGKMSCGHKFCDGLVEEAAAMMSSEPGQTCLSTPSAFLNVNFGLIRNGFMGYDEIHPVNYGEPIRSEYDDM